MLANENEIQSERKLSQENIQSDATESANIPNGGADFDEEKPFCRLCYDTKYDDSSLIKPCLCKGSMGNVHKKCLEHWLNRCGSKKCELCLFEFKTEDRLRYGLLQSIRIWTRNYRRRQYLMHDFCLFIMMNIITLTMIGLLFQAIHHAIKDEFIKENMPVWYFIALCSAAGVGVIIYFATCIMFVKTHIRPWFIWWRSVKKINLVVN